MLDASHEAHVVAAVAAAALVTPGEAVAARMAQAIKATHGHWTRRPDDLDDDVDRLLSPRTEVVTVIVGRGVDPAVADAVRMSVASAAPGADVDVYEGNQLDSGHRRWRGERAAVTAIGSTEPLEARARRPHRGALAKLGLATVGDLLRHYPRRYGAPGEFTDMTVLRDRRTRHRHGRGAVRDRAPDALSRRRDARGRRDRRPRHACSSRSSPSARACCACTRTSCGPVAPGLFTGTVGEYRGKRQLTHPDYLIVGVDAADADEAMYEASRPIPIYPAAASAPTWRIGRAVRTVLDPLTEADVPDPIPAGLRERDELAHAARGAAAVHVPETRGGRRRGQARLALRGGARACRRRWRGAGRSTRRSPP